MKTLEQIANESKTIAEDMGVVQPFSLQNFPGEFTEDENAHYEKYYWKCFAHPFNGVCLTQVCNPTPKEYYICNIRAGRTKATAAHN